ncbi:MAG: biopolymer transporter ExbD [bacterium]|nr:biopolymer transporter ExbD [bacterium]
MSRFRHAAEEDTETTIDISPMIDCVFILLIFFIVTTTFVEETGVEVDKPEAASASNLEKTSIFLAVTAGGEVIHAERPISVAGVRPLVKREIQKEKVPVIIQADAQAPAGILVRVIDEAKLGGAEKISIAADPRRS